MENEFSRAVSRDGNLKAQDRVAEVFELRREFEWRGLSVVPYSALKIREKYGAFDAERRFKMDYTLGARQQGLRMRRHSARRQAPAGLQDFRHRLHARKPGRLVHGQQRRRLCGALQLRPLQGHDAMSEVKRGYVRPLDLKHGRVDMTHGSGGRAMVQLISELFAKHLGNAYLGQGNDGAVLPAPVLTASRRGW